MIEFRDIVKRYSKEGVAALSGVSAVFGNRGLVAICGPAACGKTTLLNILGGIEQPDSGEMLIDGKPARKFREGDWNEYRNARVGFVFQDPVLVGHRSVLENVELALTIAGVKRGERRERALAALRLLGVENCASDKPASLSGAQQRLVAAARALAKEPGILIADEPTCGLDKDAAGTVMRALERAAQSRLVIMATSDEELAAAHASRVVRLADGELVGDEAIGEGAADESAAQDSEQHSDEAAGDSGLSAKSRRSMPFSAAVSYSMRNISANKGRAVLTAVASALSMMGIAAIVALVGGANNYIADMEEASIATDPIVIAKSGLDLTGLLDSDDFKNIVAESAAAQEAASSPGAAKINTVKSSIESLSSLLSETVSHFRDNDLAGFKQYVDSNSDGILDYIDTVRYDYGVAPLVYNGDTSHGVEQLNPSTLSSLLMRRANTTTDALNGLGRFNEMIDDQGILDEQMDVVCGTWPQGSDECVVVLDQDGGLSDLTLYHLGLYDHEAVDQALNAALNGESIELPEAPSELSYEQLMGASFVVLPRVSLYQKNEARGTWADKSLDDDYVAERIAQDGIRLKVSGIVKPKQDAPSALMSEGVGYTRVLADRLVEISAQSEIAQQQLANPAVDVFTGKTFEDLKEHPAGNLDLDNIITVNEQALGRLLGIFTGGEDEKEEEEEEEWDWKWEGEGQEKEKEKEKGIEKEQEGAGEGDDGEVDLLGIDLSKIDLSQFEIDARDVLDAVNMQRILDAAALASMLDPEEAGLKLTDKQEAEVNEITGEMVADFTAYALVEGATAEDLHDPDQIEQYWEDYLETDKGALHMLELDLLVGQSYGEVVLERLEEYLTTVFAEVVIDEVAAEIIEQSLDQIEKEIEKQIEHELPALSEQLGSELEAAIASELDNILNEADRAATEVAKELDKAAGQAANELDKAIGQAASELDKAAVQVANELDETAGRVSNELGNLIQINMTEEDLVAYLNNLLDSSDIGYDNNMAKLGYADKGKPLSMSIYPKGLAAKQKVVEIISNYNDGMEKAGMRDRTIIYNNSSGEMAQALSAVVDVVGLVLIALIGVTLVVGSVMMVLVVSVGVAGRRREMGILRALGASRSDLMAMFNVETLVVGLLAGVISVGVVLAISAGVNGMAANSGGADIMVLTPGVAIGLIALSGALPLLAGLVPSLVMSWKRPAQSLRG